MMRIVIDLQGAQTKGSRNRGIGRYSRALAKAIIRNCHGHEVFLLLSNNYPETIFELRTEFGRLVPKENIRVFYPLGETAYFDPNSRDRRIASEIIREACIFSLNPDVVHIASLFEGLTEDAVSSVKSFYYDAPVSVTLYDLIPLINRDPYLANPVVEEWYENRLFQLRKADLALAISKSAREEAISHLSFDEDQAVYAGTAADEEFVELEFDSGEKSKLLSKFGLRENFIMYTGGIDHRKNIERLIKAYAALGREIRSKHQLAIVCECSPENERRLKDIADEHGVSDDGLIITGYVAESDLIALYNLCGLFVFPSWHEGFGLPALEAMHCGAMVIGSNRSSVPEVIGIDEAMFDPFDVNDITRLMARALTDDKLRKRVLNFQSKHRHRFSWGAAGKIALQQFEKMHSRRSEVTKTSAGIGHRPKLAFVSPIPPANSGIANYSGELIPEMSRDYDIDLIVPNDFDGSSINVPSLKANHSFVSSSDFIANSGYYDRVLYHFGNSDHHTHMFGLLEAVPGVVVLHDFYLSGILAHMERHFGMPGVWSDALYQSHGYHAVWEREHATNEDDIIWKYPCNRFVFDNALAVVVNSQASRKLVGKWLGAKAEGKVFRIPHARTPLLNDKRADLKSRYGFDDKDFLVCSFGFMGPTKRNIDVLAAFLASKLKGDRRWRLVFVGQPSTGTYGDEIAKIIDNSGIADRISITGWTDSPVYNDYLEMADVAVQLREKSRGETSGATVDCLAAGIPMIVNAHGSMEDLPDSAVLKLPDKFQKTELIDAMNMLRARPELRLRLKENGLDLIRTEHDPRSCANSYADVLEVSYSQESFAPYRAAAAIRRETGWTVDSPDYIEALEGLDRITSEPGPRLLIDISELVNDAHIKAVDLEQGRRAFEAILLNQGDIRMEPVIFDAAAGEFSFARTIVAEILGLTTFVGEDEPCYLMPQDSYIRFETSILSLRDDLLKRREILHRAGLQEFRYDFAQNQMARRKGDAEHEAIAITEFLGAAGGSVLDAEQGIEHNV